MLLKIRRLKNFKTLNIVIESKNKKAIKRFIEFLTKKTKYFKFNLIKKFVSKRLNTKKMSILKSPHVNKKAQEQFELKMFRFEIILKTVPCFRFLTFIKKIKNLIFPEIKLKLKLNFNQKDIKENYILNKPLRYNNKKCSISKRYHSSYKLLKFLEFYGN